MSTRLCMKSMRYYMISMILNINCDNLITKMIYYYMILYVLIMNLSND